MNPADTDLATLQTLALELPVPQPHATLVWTAVVDIGEREALGIGPLGERGIVPILGGRFWGGPGYESLRGRVRAGGADRQQMRPDGVKELRAEYEIETDDGAVITVDNRVLIDESHTPQRYALSHLHVCAPDGPHAWLNRRVLVGTLQPLRPRRQAVMVRAFRIDL